MNEEYLLQLYKYISDNDTSYKNDVSFDSFRSDMSDSQYASQIYGYLNDLDSTFSDDVSVIDFIKDINTDPKQIKKKDTVVDVTSPMEPMGSTLPQEDTSGLSESEELVETEADVANPFEGMSLFKETPDYLIDKDKQKELTDLENKKFVEDIEAQSNKIAESYADELDNEFYAQEEVVNLINEANRRSKNEVQAFVDNLVFSGIDPKTEESKKKIQDYYSLIFDRELSSDEKFNSLVSSYSDVRADKVFSRVKEYQSSAAKAKKAKDLMDNPIYETLSKIPVAKNLLDNYLLSDGLVGEASSAFMYGKPASKELVPVAETSIELKKDRARLAQMDADGVDELVEYLPAVGPGAPPSKIKFTRNQVLDRIQSSSDELASLSPDKISRALDLQKISQFLSPEDQFLEGDFTLESLGGLVGQQLANQVEVPILGTYALELGASYLDTVKEIAEYKYGEASPENIIKVIDSGEDGAADLSAAAQLSATIDAFGLIPIGKGVSVATKGAIKAGSKTASKTASETFKETIIGRVKKQIKENIKDKIKNKAARKFIDDSYQVVKGSLIAGFSEFPTETTQSLLVSEASRKTIEGATGQELETDIEGTLKEGVAGFIVGSAIPFTAGSVSISGRGARDVYKSSTKSLAEKARRKIQEKSKDYLVNESPKTRVEINEIIESAKTPEDLNGIFINNDKGLEDKLTSKYNQLKDAVQEQETREVPDAEQAEGVQEVETEIREPDVEEAIPGGGEIVSGVEITFPTKEEDANRKEYRTTDEYINESVSNLDVEDTNQLSNDLEGDFGFLTGENPLNKALTEEENQGLNKKAEQWLRDKGYSPRRVTGKYNQGENSFFVPGLTKSDAIAFAKEFNQESVAHSEGLIYQDGRLNPRDKAKDNFTLKDYTPDSNFVSIVQTPDGPKTFEVGYDFDTTITPEEVVVDSEVQMLREMFSAPDAKKGDQVRLQLPKFEVSKEGKGDPSISVRNKVIQESAEKLKNGEISNEEYRATVSENSPITPITRFFEPATDQQMERALGKKSDKLNDEIEAGTIVGSRLDIPAYKNNNTWVVSIHDGNTAGGKVLSYRNVAKLKNVNFGTFPKAALNIAAGKPKTTIARMFGEFVPYKGKTSEERANAAKDELKDIVNNDRWVQVGMNPFRHSYFYDRSKDMGRPINSASEVVQIGGLVYAKDPVYGNSTDESFIVKGLFDSKGEPVRFQLSEDLESKSQPLSKLKNLARKVEKAISNITEGVSIIVADTKQDYDNLIDSLNNSAEEKAELKSANGFYDSSTKTAYINPSQATETTIVHEAVHGLISEALGSWKKADKVTNELWRTIKKNADNPELISNLEAFADMYVQDGKMVQSSEAFSELLGILSSSEQTLNQKQRNAIQKFFDEIMSFLGLKRMTVDETFELVNTLAARLASGDMITASEMAPLQRQTLVESIRNNNTVDNFIEATQTRLQGLFNVAYTVGNRINELKSNGILRDENNLSFIPQGSRPTAIFPDSMFVGIVSIDGKILFKGGGGLFYPINTGDVWASSEKAANQIAKSINQQFDDGQNTAYLILVNGSKKKLFSTTDGVAWSVSSLESMVDRGLVSKSQIRPALILAARKNDTSINIDKRSSTSDISNAFRQLFKDPNSSTYSKRGNIVDSLIGELAKAIKDKNQVSKIIELFGGDTSKTALATSQNDTKTGASLSNMISNVVTEKMINGLTTGDVYAVIEVNSRVKTAQSTHQSYDTTIKTLDGSQPKIVLLKETEKSNNVLVAASTKKPVIVAQATSMTVEIRTPMQRSKTEPRETSSSFINEVIKSAKENNISDVAILKYLKEVGVSEDVADKAIQKYSRTLTEETLTGYDKMMNRIDDIINRMSKKPDMTNDKILDSVTKNLQSRDPAYKRATDVQREQIIRDLRSRLGVKEKAAPSAKRVTGQSARKKVTVDEYASLKSQIRLEAKAAREAVTSYKNAGKKIAEAVKALGGKGKITLRQANTVAKKILRTNFTNTKQVDALLDYVQKIYERAELAEMVSNAKGRIKQARSNLGSKVGTMTVLKSVVLDVLSLDPTDVPLNLLPQYVELVQSFGERKPVLNLPEQGVVMQTANAILDSVQKSFDLTTKERVEDADYDLDQAVKEIREDKIDTENILNPDVKKLAEKLNSLTKKDIEGLVTENKDGVKNYAKVENLKAVKREMSKGYAPKLANDLAVEIESQRSYDSLENEGAIDRVQKRGIMAIGRTIASIKSIITRRGITQEQLRSIPFIGTSLDNVLGNLNQTQFREKIIDPVANAFSMMTDKMQDVRNEYLQTADYLLSNDGFVKRSRNAILKSKYKVQLYLLEKENLSNLGSNQVAPAIEFLNETIKYLSKDTSARRNMNKEILEELREGFAPNDGPLDFEKLENSLSKNEIQAATLINQAYNETSSMYEFVSSVVRGEGLKPLNNYVHHSVLKDLNEQKKDNDLTVERITKPSTKSKTIIERTPGAKAINFDPISSADRGVKMMLTDYYMTNPIREVRSLINKIKDTPDLTQFQKDAFEDLDKVFEESIEIVFGKSLESITGVNNFFNAVEELGYYAALASVPRAAAELGSNFAGAVIMNPRTFSLGVTNFSKISFDSTSVAKFAAAIGSKSRSKLAPKGIGGKIQQELTNYNVTSRNKGALNPILDKANFIAKNTTGRIGTATADLAQKLLSTPDMAISRPMYFQTFVNEFQKITGEKLTNDDLQAIADGDTKILEKYPDAVSKARDVADTAIERLSGTTNPLKQPLKYQLKVGDDAFTKVYKKANKYMASFYSVENNTATEGTIALFYSGEITRRQATSLLAMITTRMTVYMAMYAFLQNVFDQLISNALGFRQEDEEDEDYTLLTSRQLVGSISTLILRRSLGSVSSIPVMYGIEKVNEEYLGALRGGNEYDKFKNGIVYVPIRENKSPIEQGVSMLSGAKGPALNTISRLATVISGITGSDKKETRDQYTDELLNRMSIEVLGNVGLLPFYKDIRRMVIEDTFSEREYQKVMKKLQKEIEKEEQKYYREQKKKSKGFGSKRFGSKGFQ